MNKAKSSTECANMTPNGSPENKKISVKSLIMLQKATNALVKNFTSNLTPKCMSLHYQSSFIVQLLKSQATASTDPPSPKNTISKSFSTTEWTCGSVADNPKTPLISLKTCPKQPDTNPPECESYRTLSSTQYSLPKIVPSEKKREQSYPPVRTVRVTFQMQLKQWHKMSSAINGILDKKLPIEAEIKKLEMTRLKNLNIRQEIQKTKLAHPKFFKKNSKVKLFNRRIQTNDGQRYYQNILYEIMDYFTCYYLLVFVSYSMHRQVYEFQYLAIIKSIYQFIMLFASKVSSLSGPALEKVLRTCLKTKTIFSTHGWKFVTVAKFRGNLPARSFASSTQMQPVPTDQSTTVNLVNINTQTDNFQRDESINWREVMKNSLGPMKSDGNILDVGTLMSQVKMNPYYFDDKDAVLVQKGTELEKMVAKSSTINLDVAPILDKLAMEDHTENDKEKKSKRKNRFDKSNSETDAEEMEVQQEKPTIRRYEGHTKNKQARKGEVGINAKTAFVYEEKLLNNDERNEGNSNKAEHSSLTEKLQRKVVKPLKKLVSSLGPSSSHKSRIYSLAEVVAKPSKLQEMVSLKSKGPQKAKPTIKSAEQSTRKGSQTKKTILSFLESNYLESSSNKKHIRKGAVPTIKTYRKSKGRVQTPSISEMSMEYFNPEESTDPLLHQVFYTVNNQLQLLPTLPPRNMCLLIQKHKVSFQFENLYVFYMRIKCIQQIVENVPILVPGSKNKLRQLTYRDLLMPSTEPVNLAYSIENIKGALGEDGIDSVRLINIDIPKLQTEIKEAINKKDYNFAADKLAYMMNFNGRYRKGTGPGYILNKPLVAMFKMTFSGDPSTVSDKKKEISAKRIIKEAERVSKERGGEELEKNIPFLKTGRKSVDKQLKELLEKPVSGFALVKYKTIMHSKEANQSISKYVGIKTSYGTLYPTTTMFCNYLYVGSPIFSSLHSPECANTIKRLLKNKAEEYIYDLSLPRPKNKFTRAKEVSEAGLIQIRYRSFEETLRAYDAFVQSVFY
eukprot:TRINITY_DN513_c0_g1_i6.p1 TRINITY_DN513_c0_g1~~TRINITY_DN513_c0_g1_i6.p1  ORF type:complete len:1014 (-),score=101.03 TRINITY_DN513_c0_g1_i6:17297-20338(-)